MDKGRPGLAIITLLEQVEARMGTPLKIHVEATRVRLKLLQGLLQEHHLQEIAVEPQSSRPLLNLGDLREDSPALNLTMAMDPHADLLPQEVLEGSLSLSPTMETDLLAGLSTTQH